MDDNSKAMLKAVAMVVEKTRQQVEENKETLKLSNKLIEGMEEDNGRTGVIDVLQALTKVLETSQNQLGLCTDILDDIHKILKEALED